MEAVSVCPNRIIVCVLACVLSHVRPFGSHGLKSSRFLCPWDFPGKNTGVGSHFLELNCVSCRILVKEILYHGATWEAPTESLKMFVSQIIASFPQSF